MKKNIIFILVIIGCIFIITFQYFKMENIKREKAELSNENIMLKEGKNISKSEKSEDKKESKISPEPEKNEENFETPDNSNSESNKKIQLREGIEISVYDNEANLILDKQITKPAYGPVCTLNAYAINLFEGKNITVLEDKDDYFTKVRIEGIIPKWAIKKNGDEEIKYVDEKIMYVINECTKFYIPDESSVHVCKMFRGNSVTIKAEYGNWYYVRNNYYADQCQIPYGWIKKSNLGYYGEFDSNIKLEVNLKKGSPIRFTGTTEIQTVENCTTWARIYGETENEYVVLLPGASEARIEKKYVEPFVTKTNEFEAENEIKPFNDTDMKVSNIKTFMSYKEVISLLGEPDKEERRKTAFAEIICFYGDDLKIAFVDDEVYSIEILSNKYKTERGLTIGDKLESLITKYGEPHRIDRDIYKYAYEGKEEDDYDVFFVKVLDGKVAEITISLDM